MATIPKIAPRATTIITVVLRDDTELYFGCIIGDAIRVWNPISGNEATVTYSGNAKDYLTGTKPEDYHVLTIQDTSIITNKLIEADEQDKPSYVTDGQGTIILKIVEYSAEYKVTVDGSTYKYTSRNADELPDDGTDVKLNAAEILGALKTGIEGLGKGVTVTLLPYSLELTKGSTFSLKVEGGVNGEALESYQDEVQDISQLSRQSIQNRWVKIAGIGGPDDDYYRKFKAVDGTKGTGVWIESKAPGASPGLKAETMPHELISTDVDTFVFQEITWESRLVGDENSNPTPSFVGKKIQQSFFYDENERNSTT